MWSPANWTSSQQVCVTFRGRAGARSLYLQTPNYNHSTKRNRSTFPGSGQPRFISSRLNGFRRSVNRAQRVYASCFVPTEPTATISPLALNRNSESPQVIRLEKKLPSQMQKWSASRSGTSQSFRRVVSSPNAQTPAVQAKVVRTSRYARENAVAPANEPLASAPTTAHGKPWVNNNPT